MARNTLNGNGNSSATVPDARRALPSWPGAADGDLIGRHGVSYAVAGATKAQMGVSVRRCNRFPDICTGDIHETANDDSSRHCRRCWRSASWLGGRRPSRRRRRARTNATASPRPGKTTAPRASTPAPARAPSTTIPSRGSTSPRAPAKRSAARRPRRSPNHRRPMADVDVAAGAAFCADAHGCHVRISRRRRHRLARSARRRGSRRAARRSDGSRCTAKTISSTAARRWPRSTRYAPTIRCRCTA